MVFLVLLLEISHSLFLEDLLDASHLELRLFLVEEIGGRLEEVVQLEENLLLRRQCAAVAGISCDDQTGRHLGSGLNEVVNVGNGQVKFLDAFS